MARRSQLASARRIVPDHVTTAIAGPLRYAAQIRTRPSIEGVADLIMLKDRTALRCCDIGALVEV
jgi:hypothetical protein